MKNVSYEEMYRLLMLNPITKELLKWKIDNIPEKLIIYPFRKMGKTQLRKLNEELGFEFTFKNKDEEK